MFFFSGESRSTAQNLIRSFISQLLLSRIWAHTMANLINLVIRRTMSSGSGAIKHVTVIGGGLMGSGIVQVRRWNLTRVKVQLKLSAPELELFARNDQRLLNISDKRLQLKAAIK